MSINAKARRLFISSVIVIILGIQAIATFGALVDLHARKKFWPWIDYPMYEKKFVDGDRINVSGSIFALTDSGEKIPVTDENLKVGFWKFHYVFSRLSFSDEPQESDIELILGALPDDIEGVSAIETYNYPLVIRREGPVEKDSELIRRIEIEK